MKARKYILARLLLIALSIGIVLVGAEIILRMQPAHKVRYRDRPLLYMWQAGERLNPWAAGAENALRIAVVGDSMTIGQGVQLRDAYGSQLEWMLNVNTGTPPAAVRIFARPGTTALDQLDLLGQALEFKPDLIIWGICLNDAENPHNREELMEWRRRMLVRKPPAWLQGILRNSRILAWMYKKKEHARISRAFVDYYRFLYEDQQEGWLRLIRGADIFKESCERENVPLLAVILPAMSHIDLPEYPLQHCHDKIRGMLEERDIRCLDLSKPFTGYSHMRMEVIPRLDAHPSEIGHRLIADHLFAYLLDNQLIDKAYYPQYIGGFDIEDIWDFLEENRE